MSTDTLIHAPWTENEVAALNAWQCSGLVHPMTCGANEEHTTSQTLVAELDGWHCPDANCTYTQDWALGFMGSTEALESRRRRVQDYTWGQSAYVAAESQGPALREVERLRALLRRTEDELAEARARIATLEEKNRAMRIVLSRITTAQKLGQKPQIIETGGECDPVWVLGTGAHRDVEDHELPEEG